MRLASVPTYTGDNEIVKAYTIDDFPYSKLRETKILTKHKKKTVTSYFVEFGTFDIETTTIDNNFDSTPWGFMYHWQMSVAGIYVYGRRWEEWIEFLKKLQSIYNYNREDHFVIYVHNLSFEFQFIRELLDEYCDGFELFATGSRKVLRVTCGNGLEFRCSYLLTNMALGKAVENEKSCHFRKAIGDLDYSLIRTADTPLTDEEFGYCIGDVATLHELIANRLKNEHDNLETIPMTSTGYVRRDARRNCRKDKRYYEYFKSLEIREPVYNLLKETARGGNTHANRYFSGRIWEDVDSYDVASSYPAQMMLREFPVTAFHPYGEVTTEEFKELLNTRACLFRCIFSKLRIKPEVTIPYIPVAKCLKCEKDGLIDNGRLLKAKYAVMTLTDIDFKIIRKQYDWDSISIADMHTAEYGLLPAPIRETVMQSFRLKSELKYAISQESDKDKIEDLNYLYAKSKNRLNGIFGMCYTDPVRALYTINSEGKWIVETPGIEESLKKYWKSRNSFLYYAWGVWITARAREHLQVLLDVTGEGTIYCDTDSSKAINVDRDLIETLNDNIRKEAKEKGAYAEVGGKEYFLGVYEYEGTMRRFETLGAKKYAYEDEDGELNITIAGVSKKLGAIELGRLENFVPGFIFREAGGKTLYYNDVCQLGYIDIDGCRMLSGSNIGLVDSTYEIGITDEYAEVIGFNIYNYE